MTNEELVMEIQRGQADLMPQLWEQVAGLVKWKANRVINALDGAGGVEFDDLYNSGYLALVDAAPTYDPEGGAFSTWFMFYLKTAFAVATGYRTKTQREDPSRYALSLDAPLSDDPDSGSLDEIIKDPRGESALEAVEQEYLVDLNATQAAIRAGYSEKNAEQMGYQLLHKTSVQQAIQKAMKKREQRLEITQDRVVQELAELVRLAEDLLNAVANIQVGDDVIGQAALRYTRREERARGW